MGAGCAVAFVVVLVIAGAIGLFVFSKPGFPERTFDPPWPNNQKGPAPAGNFPKKTPAGADKTDAIIGHLKKRSAIGSFTLQNIVPSADNKIYGNSQGEAKAVYTAGSTTVTFLVAEYRSASEASVEFGRFIGRERSKGSKILAPPKVVGKSINGEFENSNGRYVAFCNWPDGAAILCHLISAADAKQLNEFRSAIKAGTQ